MFFGKFESNDNAARNKSTNEIVGGFFLNCFKIQLTKRKQYVKIKNILY